MLLSCHPSALAASMLPFGLAACWHQQQCGNRAELQDGSAGEGKIVPRPGTRRAGSVQCQGLWLGNGRSCAVPACSWDLGAAVGAQHGAPPSLGAALLRAAPGAPGSAAVAPGCLDPRAVPVPVRPRRAGAVGHSPAGGLAGPGRREEGAAPGRRCRAGSSRCWGFRGCQRWLCPSGAPRKGGPGLGVGAPMVVPVCGSCSPALGELPLV